MNDSVREALSAARGRIATINSDIHYMENYEDSPTQREFDLIRIASIKRERSYLTILCDTIEHEWGALETFDKINAHYDSSYGDEKLCTCGHAYYRHFDTYDEMRHVGCKYCECFTFVQGDK